MPSECRKWHLLFSMLIVANVLGGREERRGESYGGEVRKLSGAERRSLNLARLAA
jgi:hypothetical protein